MCSNFRQTITQCLNSDCFIISPSDALMVYYVPVPLSALSCVVPWSSRCHLYAAQSPDGPEITQEAIIRMRGMW